MSQEIENTHIQWWSIVAQKLAEISRNVQITNISI